MNNYIRLTVFMLFCSRWSEEKLELGNMWLSAGRQKAICKKQGDTLNRKPCLPEEHYPLQDYVSYETRASATEVTTSPKYN